MSNRVKFFCRAAAWLVVSFFLLAGASAAHAQCPTSDNIGWGREATVRFFLDSNLTGEQRRQARWAVAEWNRANSLNGARVRFEEDFTGQNFQFRFLNGPLSPGTPAFAQKVFGSDGTVVSGTLTYDQNATFTGTNTLIADPTRPGYDTFLIKITLHEIGHTMGLDHPASIPANACDQQDGATVMNFVCGVNDQGNNFPLELTACDQGAINSEPRYPAFTQSPNPIDETQFFVRQQYLDFLNRQPDGPGFSFWTNNIESCGANPQCREVKRIDTSAAFFLSIEFQQTGYFVYRVYKAAFGDLAGKPVPITIQEFLPETERVGRGVVVGVGNWEQQLETNRQEFVNEFVARTRFVARFGATSNEQYIDTLNTGAGGVLSAAERQSLVDRLNGGQISRAQALREVAEDADLRTREFNRAFVLEQYYGYLRRDPDDAPEPGLNFAGYNFWLSKLNQFNGDFRAAEMVKSFLISGEYRRRFGQP